MIFANQKLQQEKDANQNGESLIRTILRSIRLFYNQESNSEIQVGSPYLSVLPHVENRDHYLMTLSLMGKYEGNVIISVPDSMMLEFVKDNLHESVKFDDPKTSKQLCNYMVQKMSQSIGKNLMKALGKDTFISVSKSEAISETLKDDKPITVPVGWKHHKFFILFYI